MKATRSEQVCDGVVLGFSIWTLCCHATVAMGGDLRQLIGLSAAASAIAGLFWIQQSRRPSIAEPGDPEEPEPNARWLRLARLLGFALALFVVVAIDPETRPGMLWWASVTLLGAATAVALRAPSPRIEQPTLGRLLELGLWGIAVSCAIVALAMHRPDIDDAFYLNVAVSAADDAAGPLLAEDTMLGVAGLPLHMPAHRVHSYELWNGALSYLTGIPVIYCFHWISASLVALLVPLAHARLFRLLTPRHWLAATAALVVVLLATGETHRSYGNFAFVRIWQGKAVFLFFFLPLVYSYAIGFANRPTTRRWLLLGAAQVGALGCSATAVWIAPAGALIALACALDPSRRGLLTLARGALSSLYVLLIGWLLKGSLQPMLAPEIAEVDFGGRLAIALGQVLGDSWLLVAGIGAMLMAWTCCSRSLARRYAIAFPLAVLLIPLNPYWDRWVCGNLTGPSYWRALWCLPLPSLLSLVLVSPLQVSGSPLLKWGGRAIALAITATYAVSIPAFSTLSMHNVGMAGVGIWAGIPAPKAPPLNYRWAELLTRSVPPGSQVVAPPEISVWLPTFHDRVHPLQARRMYLDRQIGSLGSQNVATRKEMTLFAGGENHWPNPRRSFGRGLADFDVTGVCLRNSPIAAVARAVLAGTGFRLEHGGEQYEIWVRRGLQGPALGPDRPGPPEPAPGAESDPRLGTGKEARRAEELVG